MVDEAGEKRGLAAAAIVTIAAGALQLAWRTSTAYVVSARAVLAIAGLFLGTALNAITIGVVGARGFDWQLGRNQSFAAAGNVLTALLMAGVSCWIGIRNVSLCAAILVLPTLGCLARVRSNDIDLRNASGAGKSAYDYNAGIFAVLLKGRVLLIFFLSAALFHLSNAAMLPQMGEMLAHGDKRTAGPLMSACVIVTQLVITFIAAQTGRLAGILGRRPLLLMGFAALVWRLRNDYTGDACFAHWILRRMSSPFAFQV